MSIDVDRKTSLEIGEVFQDGKKEYKVVGKFVDEGQDFYVCKSASRYGGHLYANILTYSDSLKRWMFHI
jgi:hypothetical protein